MELREVIGRRRSIRFVRPYRPVEPEKIQRTLEAARLASHWGNVQSLRAVVVFRHSAPPETLDALYAPIAGWQIRLARSRGVHADYVHADQWFARQTPYPGRPAASHRS